MDAALENLWVGFSEKLRAFIQSRVSDVAASEDILQDVFLKMHTKIGQLQDSSKAQGWLFLITRNAIIDYYRTRKKTVEVPESMAAADGEEGSEEHEALNAAFLRMIHSLPDPYREALLLTEFEGLTQKDLAGRLGISVSGAKSRVQRGREQLREKLLECCSFEFDRRGKIIECSPRRKENCPECK